MNGWIQDFRYALRSISGARQFALIVVATLALGIGANTAVFGVLDAVVLKPLPYAQPEQLVRLYKSVGGEDTYLPRPPVLQIRETSRTLELAAVGNYSAAGADLTDRGRPERIRTLPVSANYFHVLRVEPALGRVFTQDDERPTTRVAVISGRVWRDYFDRAPDAAGRTLSMNGQAYRVAAVLPDDFVDPLEPQAEVWTPLDLQPAEGNTWGNHYLSAIARLRPGVTLDQARAELSTMASVMPWNGPRVPVKATVRVAPLQADTVGSAGPMLWVLLGAVGLLLLIACVNVASLFLARGAGREAELAIRTALGSSRWRIARQLLVESVLLSLAGGAVGLLLAGAVTRTLLALAPEAVARTAGGSLAGATFAFGFGVALLAGILFGLAPALQFTGTGLEAFLRGASRGSSGTRRQTRTRNALVVCQIALALVLLIGAGLLLRSFDRLRAVGLGVRPAGVTTFEVHLPAGRYPEADQRARFHVDLEQRIAALPGVRAAGAVSRLPVTGAYHTWPAERIDRPRDTPMTLADQRVIEGDYFQALGIPLLRGRTFAATDDARAPRRVVISQSFARELFGEADPIGQPLAVTEQRVEIIGVVADVASAPRGGVRPIVYHSHRQFAGDRNWALTQVVAVDGETPAPIERIRRELAGIDPSLVLYRPRLLTDIIGLGVAQERFALWLIAAFAVLAVVLAAVGIYGVLSYGVTRRRREMGIRMALGATAASVWGLVVRDGGRLAALGLALGLGGALVATRALRSLLFDVTATDPLVFAAAVAALALVALIASGIPARAATRVNPLESVRSDG